MAVTEEEFQEAVLKVRKLKSLPTNEELLYLYAFFKQATEGDNKADSPGMFDLKAKAKWHVWNEKKGMSSADAKDAYVERVKQLIEKYGLQE